MLIVAMFLHDYLEELLGQERTQAKLRVDFSSSKNNEQHPSEKNS